MMEILKRFKCMLWQVRQATFIMLAPVEIVKLARLCMTFICKRKGCVTVRVNTPHVVLHVKQKMLM